MHIEVKRLDCVHCALLQLFQNYFDIISFIYFSNLVGVVEVTRAKRRFGHKTVGPSSKPFHCITAF